MRALALLAAAALALPAAAQDKAPAPKPAKKAARAPVAHKKPTREQIRRFDELERKQESKKPERGREPN